MSNVLTIGSFDLLHIGHIQFFQKCAKLGTLTVMVNPDRYIKEQKGHWPVMSEPVRTAMVSAIVGVQSAWAYQSTPDIKEGVAFVRPTYLVVGDDWAGRDYLAHIGLNARDLDEMDTTLLYLPRSGSESTSAIVARIREGS